MKIVAEPPIFFFQRYQELLGNLPVNLLQVPENVLSSVHLAVIRLSGASPVQHREVFEYLRISGIGVQLHYRPVHFCSPYLPRALELC